LALRSDRRRLLGIDYDAEKIALADQMAQWVNPVFENAALYTGFEHWMATYGYALQIYCDFSGYTDVAIGLAACLGFTLPVNFRSPYKADSFTDFWHRWHITLSTWFRDYVYIPLGGNRHGTARMILALLVSMTLCGIWHGAALNFLLWGLMHGLFLAFEKLTGLNRRPRKTWARVLKTIVYFHLICLSWVIFRTDSLQAAGDWFLGLCQTTPFATIGSIIVHYNRVFALMLLGFALHFLPQAVQDKTKLLFCQAPWPIRFLICLLAGVALILTRTAVPQPFIYFSF
ncbi:MAG: MBOAT family protein, partial [Bacteroidales bacterium]|nr:MBOAT family protein [Bacteroidales bacterium]